MLAEGSDDGRLLPIDKGDQDAHMGKPRQERALDIEIGRNRVQREHADGETQACDRDGVLRTACR